MFRVGVIAAAGLALAGCSGSSISMPDWLTIKPPPPPAETLRFESQPPGAEARTAQGQACRTPCALAVPLQNQTVTFSMNGYLPQTIPVTVQQSGERSEVTFESEPPSFAPNPVEAALEPAPSSRKPPPPPKKKPVAKPKPTTNTASAPNTPQPAPTQPAPLGSPFPPPPTFQPSR
jgi:hypothetical protein